jgi:hypothetical protein
MVEEAGNLIQLRKARIGGAHRSGCRSTLAMEGGFV